jgi:hypothetical protein
LRLGYRNKGDKGKGMRIKVRYRDKGDKGKVMRIKKRIKKFIPCILLFHDTINR